MKKIIFLFISIVIATNLEADITVKYYKDLLKTSGEIKTHEIIERYFAGVGKGYFWANAYLEATKQPLLYCQNNNLALNNYNYVKIMHQEYMSGKYDDNDIMEFILLAGLQKTFPCR